MSCTLVCSLNADIRPASCLCTVTGSQASTIIFTSYHLYQLLRGRELAVVARDCTLGTSRPKSHRHLSAEQELAHAVTGFMSSISASHFTPVLMTVLVQVSYLTRFSGGLTYRIVFHRTRTCTQLRVFEGSSGS